MATSEFVFATSLEPTKQVVRIEKAKYDAVHTAILENLRTYGSMTFSQLGDLVEDQLQKNFDGSVAWYYTVVKLDMEACGEVYRVPKSKPQKIALYEDARIQS